MQMIDNLSKLSHFSFILDENKVIQGYSKTIESSPIGMIMKGWFFHQFLETLFLSETFYNKQFYNRIVTLLEQCITERRYVEEDVLITDQSLQSAHSYDFSFSIDVIVSNHISIIVTFDHFRLLTTKDELYQKLFDVFPSEFTVLERLHQIGMFVIDYSLSKNLLYGNDILAKLLGIKPTPDKTYIFTRYANKNAHNAIIRDREFFLKSDMLVQGDIDTLTDEWTQNDKYLHLEAKVLKRDANGNCLLIGGIVYDVSDYRDYKDIQYLQSIYELAITSGGIGIFHYDVDKHGSNVFEANNIYANLFGFDITNDSLYKLEDFERSLMPLEDEISSNEDVFKSLDRLIHGTIEGTTDDIVKIRNLKTGEIYYLLSSSKIDIRYPDGSPRRFGGIVVDITDRIQREKNQMRFAYTDELTRLSNNRRLMKDMLQRSDGIGLFFDLDNFKKINDSFGHLMGDKILKLYADCILYVSKQYDNVFPYRLYGDEFFIFAQEYSTDFAFEFEQKVMDRIDELLPSLGKKINLKASMGCSFYTVGMDIDDFIKEADYAMYKTKIKKKSKQKQARN